MILILTSIAVLLFKMLDNIATPISVKTLGLYLEPPQLEVTNCDLKFCYSFSVNKNMKSLGNRSRFLLTL